MTLAEIRLRAWPTRKSFEAQLPVTPIKANKK